MYAVNTNGITNRNVLLRDSSFILCLKMRANKNNKIYKPMNKDAGKNN